MQGSITFLVAINTFISNALHLTLLNRLSIKSSPSPPHSHYLYALA